MAPHGQHADVSPLAGRGTHSEVRADGTVHHDGTAPRRQAVRDALALCFGDSHYDQQTWQIVAVAFDEAWPEGEVAAVPPTELQELHPWYGPCDGMGPKGTCAECAGITDGEVARLLNPEMRAEEVGPGVLRITVRHDSGEECSFLVSATPLAQAPPAVVAHPLRGEE